MTNHEKHILLWDELARTGATYEDKGKVFDGLFPKEHAINNCWLCEECDWECYDCPVGWQKPYCDMTGTIYQDWVDSDDIATRKRLAAQIRDLPWREK